MINYKELFMVAVTIIICFSIGVYTIKKVMEEGEKCKEFKPYACNITAWSYNGCTAPFEMTCINGLCYLNECIGG